MSSTISPVGPGQYNVSQEFGQYAPKYSIRGKFIRKDSNENPGPGSYDPKRSLSHLRPKSALIGPTGGEKSERFQLGGSPVGRDTPGPGNYHKDEYFAKDAKSVVLLGRSKEREDLSKPGPGAYDPVLSLVKAAVRGINIASSLKSSQIERTGKDDDIPGPGSYANSVHVIGSNTPAYSFRGKVKDAKKHDNPGPGHYDNKTSSKSPVFKIGTEQRIKPLKPSTGPDFYDVKLK